MRHKVLLVCLTLCSTFTAARQTTFVGAASGDPPPATLVELEERLNDSVALIMDITPHAPWPSLDSDRAFTLGLAYGLGKPIYLFTQSQKKFDQRVIEAFQNIGRDDFHRESDMFKRLFDPDNYALEEFGLWDNLMIDGAASAAHPEIFRSLAEAESFVTPLWRMNVLPEIRHPDILNAYFASNVYLAGPDVFLEFPYLASENKRRILAQFALSGLFPMDNEVQGIPNSREMALSIFNGNIQMMMNSGSVIFNLTPFRGPDIDPGTAFEVGFMHAKNRVLYAYSKKSLRGVATFVKGAIKANEHRIERSFTAAAAQIFIDKQSLLSQEGRSDFCKNTLAAKAR